MSILLMILAGVVIYYLYITLQEYLKNPTKISSPRENRDSTDESSAPTYTQATPYSTQSKAQKLQNSYEGASVSMLGLVLEAGVYKAHTLSYKNHALESSTLDSLDSKADSKTESKTESKAKNAPISLLQQALIDEFLQTLSIHNTKDHYEQDLRTLLYHYAPTLQKSLESTNTAHSTNTTLDSTNTLANQLDCSDLIHTDVSTLAGVFLDHTYGEYKKRLGFVGFLLMLAWSDRELNSKEQDIILDVAAFLELDNDDFNALYEQFEAHIDSNTSTPNQESVKEAIKVLESALTQAIEQGKARDEVILQEVFSTQVAKICAKDRKKDTPYDVTLQKLLDYESAYNIISKTLATNTAQTNTNTNQTSRADSASTD